MKRNEGEGIKNEEKMKAKDSRIREEKGEEIKNEEKMKKDS